MSNGSKKMFQGAAGAAGGATGGYIAIAMAKHPTNNTSITLLDNTDPATLSLAQAYTLADERDGYSCAFSDDGESSDALVVASTKGNIGTDFFNVHLLDHSSGTLTGSDTYTTSGTENVQAYAVDYYGTASSGKVIVATSYNSAYGSLFLLTSSSGTLSASSAATPATEYMGSVDFSPDGDYAAVCSDTGTTMWLYSTSGSLSQSATYTAADYVNDVAFSPDGNYIAIAHSNGSPGLVLLDHTTAGSLSFEASYTFNDTVRCVAFSPDGNYLACGLQRQSTPSGTKSLTVLDHTTAGSLSFGSTVDTGANVHGVQFSPTGEYLGVTAAASFYNDTFRLYSNTSGTISLAASYGVGQNYSNPPKNISFSRHAGLT